MEKVGEGGFQALSKLTREILLIVALISSAKNIFYADAGQYKRCLTIRKKKQIPLIFCTPQFDNVLTKYRFLQQC